VPPKHTKREVPLSLVLRNDTGVLVRGIHERKAGWWVLVAGDEDLSRPRPEPGDGVRGSVLTSQETGTFTHPPGSEVCGIGRGYADDALNRAGCRLSRPQFAEHPDRRAWCRSPVCPFGRNRFGAPATGGLSEPKLAPHLQCTIGWQPCRSAVSLLRVSYESHEVVYCKRCQTKGAFSADRPLSRC